MKQLHYFIHAEYSLNIIFPTEVRCARKNETVSNDTVTKLLTAKLYDQQFADKSRLPRFQKSSPRAVLVYNKRLYWTMNSENV